MNSPAPDYVELIRAAVCDERGFQRLILTGPARAREIPWDKIIVRPVRLRGTRHYQVVCSDAKKSHAKNVAPAAISAEIGKILGVGFTRIHLQSAAGDIHVRVTRKGHALVTRGAPSRPDGAPALAHDHARQHVFNTPDSDVFLRAVGIKNEVGEVRPSMQAKFRQINHFITLLEPLLPAPDPAAGPVTILDCGCGSAHLTFALYHFLAHIRRTPARVTGIDKNGEVVEKCLRLRDELGWPDLDFQAVEIARYEPAAPPDFVLSLHACDTATDEALARGVAWASRGLVAAPCCQHELHRQLQHPAFAAALRHGILRERLADITTDALRAAALRIMGYTAEVVEFVAPEFTGKNLMIRAARQDGSPAADAGAEYLALKAFWGVEPAIERLLGAEFKQRLN